MSPCFSGDTKKRYGVNVDEVTTHNHRINTAIKHKNMLPYSLQHWVKPTPHGKSLQSFNFMSIVISIPSVSFGCSLILILEMLSLFKLRMESQLSDCLFWSNWISWRKLKVGSHSTAVLHNSIFTGDTRHKNLGHGVRMHNFLNNNRFYADAGGSVIDAGLRKQFVFLDEALLRAGNDLYSRILLYKSLLRAVRRTRN